MRIIQCQLMKSPPKTYHEAEENNKKIPPPELSIV